MKINLEYIKVLKPCKDRLDNYIKHYDDFDGSVKQFSQLSEITYQDKIWVLTKVATKQQKHIWGALCAQSVLHLYENKYPNDDRPRKAVEVALTGEPDATAAAAYAAAAADAYTAAAYADAAAAYAAHAAYAAAYADARKQQQQKNLDFLVNLLEGESI